MNSRAVRGRVVIEESRIGKLESDVQHLQSDVTELTMEFGAIRTSIEALHTSIERAKLWMVVTGAGTILSVWGAAIALARILKP